jgi:predicted nucleic acid-binding protein
MLVYAQQMDGKGDRARALFAGGGKLSVQVLNEFTAVSRRKQRRDWREIDEAVADVLTMVDPPLLLTLDLHNSARALAQDHRLSFYDALIVSTAIEAGCDTLFSEDMQHGRSIGGLAIVNPFLEGAG